MKRSGRQTVLIVAWVLILVLLLIGVRWSAQAQDYSQTPPKLTVESDPRTYQTSVEQELNQIDGNYYSGPLEYIDPRYGYSLSIPSGWLIYPSDPAAVIATALICNYDPQAVEDLHLEFPEDAVCVQLGMGAIDTNESFAEWVMRKRASELDPEYSGPGNRQASSIDAVRLGEYVGAAVLLINTSGNEVLELDIPSGSSVLVAAIGPADSAAVGAAISILRSLSLISDDIDLHIPQMSYSVGSTIPAEILEVEALLHGEDTIRLPKQLSRLLQKGREELAAISSPLVTNCSQSGLFDKGEAPTSPISLKVPFKSGETWRVGGYGSFYGNWAHGNCNNDYYATDWNRDNDYGADVLPAAPGNISNATSPCASTALGCSVGVTHDSGIKTTYGHLSQIYKYSGSAILGERIGAVGNTGCNSTDPPCGFHLHLGFHKLDNGAYKSRCNSGIVGGKCPNGENPSAPQTPRPSPITTQNGILELVDGDWYTSNNSGGGGGTSCANITYNGIVLYDDKNCGGDKREFGGATDWIDVSDFNDRASSVHVKSGWSVLVYEHSKNDQNGGKSRCLTGSMWDLSQDYYPGSSTNMNNSISSIRVFTNGNCTVSGPPTPTHSLQMYKDANWQSGYCYMDNAGYYTNIDGCAGYNDQISSLVLKSGWSARVFEHQKLGGGHKCFTGAESDMGGDHYENGANLNDSISSVILYNTSSCAPWPPVPTHSIQLYKDENWISGSCYADNPGNYANLDGCAGYNDAITSLLLKSGWSVRIFEHPDFGGGHKCFTGNEANMDGDKYDNGTDLNNTISSMVLYNAANCPAWQTKPPPPSLSSPPDGHTYTEGESITLSWNSASSATEYYGDFSSSLGTNPFGWQASTSMTIGAQWPGYEYAWRVRARNSAGESDYSSVWNFKVIPATPTNLSAQANACGVITLSWNDSSSSEDGYKIYRDGTEIASVGGNSTTYSDTGRAELTSYSYTVRATRNGFLSNESASGTATTPACACVPGENGLVLYELPNYGGRCVTLTEENPNLSDLNFNNMASSVQFVGSYAGNGWQASLFRNENYNGLFSNFNSNDVNLADNQINDNNASSVLLWQDSDDYRGLTYGQTISGMINRVSDYDHYTFDGVQGQTVAIMMAGAGPDSFLVLMNSRWQVLASDDNNAGGLDAFIQYTLPATGRYRLLARDASANATGSYNLGLSLISNPPCVPGTNGIVLYEHSYYTGWCITLTASDSSLLNNYFSDVASSVRFVGSYRNSGWQVALFDWQNYSGNFATFNFDDPDLSDNRVGNDRTTSVAVWLDPDDNRTLRAWQPLDGRIHGRFDVDTYVFYGAAGQTVSISMDRTDNSNLDPYLHLFSSNWTQLAVDDDAGDGTNALISSFTLPTSGIYRVQARSFGFYTMGNYRITVSLP